MSLFIIIRSVSKTRDDVFCFNFSVFFQVDDERVAEELFREQAGSAASQKTDRGSSSERDTDR